MRSHFENGKLRVYRMGFQQYPRIYKIQPEDNTYPLKSRQLFRQESRQFRPDYRLGPDNRLNNPGLLKFGPKRQGGFNGKVRVRVDERACILLSWFYFKLGGRGPWVDNGGNL